MSKYDNIGELMHLPLESITPSNETFYENEFVINAAAEALLQSNGRNWIPLIVIQTDSYKYKVVANHFIYVVAEQAYLERVWSMVIPSDEQSIKQVKLLTREISPQININTASEEMITAALHYLTTLPENPLKGVDIIIAGQRIASASDRKNWTTLQPITKLKCKIPATKLDILNKVFFISNNTQHTTLPEITKTLEPINIKQATYSEILERMQSIAQQHPHEFHFINLEEMSEVIFNADKSKWRSLNPLEKLDTFFDKKKIAFLKTLFTTNKP